MTPVVPTGMVSDDQHCPLASNPALRQGGIYLASLTACLPASVQHTA